MSFQTGTPFARKRVQPIDGHSFPVPPRGLSRMCSYDLIMSNGTLPSKEKTKFPLLRGLMLQRPALRRIGLAVAFAIFSLTSLTIASAARFCIWVSFWESISPPVRKTVTSVMVGSGLPLLHCVEGCGMLVAAAAAPAYDAGATLACRCCSVPWPGALALPLPFLPFPLRETRVKSSSTRVVGCAALVCDALSSCRSGVSLCVG